MEKGSDQPRGGAYVYALRDEEAYLQTDKDEKPETAKPSPDLPGKCWFCWKSDRRVRWGAKYPVRDPNTFAVIAEVFICDECVARFAEPPARESPGTPP